jgi:hypothetical protein
MDTKKGDENMARPRKDGKFLNVKIPMDLYNRVTEYADSTKLSKTSILELALTEYLDKVSPKK